MNMRCFAEEGNRKGLPLQLGMTTQKNHVQGTGAVSGRIRETRNDRKNSAVRELPLQAFRQPNAIPQQGIPTSPGLAPTRLT